MKVKLGKKYRDKISGFEGTATGKYEYLNGCVRYELTASKLRDGKVLAQVFDEEQLEALNGKKPKLTSKSGGPRDTPARTGH